MREGWKIAPVVHFSAFVPAVGKRLKDAHVRLLQGSTLYGKTRAPEVRVKMFASESPSLPPSSFGQLAMFLGVDISFWLKISRTKSSVLVVGVRPTRQRRRLGSCQSQSRRHPPSASGAWSVPVPSAFFTRTLAIIGMRAPLP